MKLKKVNLDKAVISLAGVLALVCGGSEALADKGSTGAANGQPFQYLQSQIDAVKASLGELSTEYGLTLANLESDVAYLQSQVDSLTSQLVDLQENVDVNSESIKALQAQIGELEAELASKQEILDGSCPEGSSLRVIEPDGGFICESAGESGAAGSLYTVTHYSGYLPAYRYGSTVHGVASCPEGTKVLSGGYVVAVPSYPRAAINVLQNVPYGSSGWRVDANNTGSSRYVEMVRVVAYCGI